jgi:hypothetical protein
MNIFADVIDIIKMEIKVKRKAAGSPEVRGA